MNAIPLINNISKSNINNEKQLRQEINTSLVALKKEAGTLEGLINEAAQMLVTINNRIATLENDTVKKSDIVDVVQSGNLQPVTSNAVANSNAMPVNSVTSGNMHSVTSGAVFNATRGYLVWENPDSTQTFDAQTITFDREVPSEYSRLRVEYRNLNTEDYMFIAECDIGMRTYLESSYVTSGGIQWVASRLFRNTTRTRVDIEVCRAFSSASGTQNSTGRCIPHKIWAIP